MTTLHRTLMENTLYGYDVLPSAVHLTASTLAMLAPEVAFIRMNLFVMPLGLDKKDARLGSLDFLDTDAVKTQMALDYSQAETLRTGAAGTTKANATVPKLNLCAMNPPFVRSVGGNLLFGSLPDSERAELQRELKKRVSRIGANATAGLGSVFIALADRHLKVGGRLAFVLPAALATGEAWAPSRKLLADRYHLEIVVASHDAERPNFSENTDLSELLFIARKLKPKETPGRTTHINLWRNPRSIHEALDLATRIEGVQQPVPVDGAGLSSIKGTNAKLGEIVTVPAVKGEDGWTGALFAQTELLRACWSLQRGVLRIPGVSTAQELPVCRLDALGTLGYDRRDIHDAFEYSTTDWSPYAAFWGHEAAQVTKLAQKPNGWLVARTEAAEGRKLKDAAAVWGKAGMLLLVERLWPITHRVLAVRLDQKALGNTWWSFTSDGLSEKQEKALCLWLNSSLAILLYFGRRVVTRSAWMQMKKPGWEAMPVLDVRNLDQRQTDILAGAYDALADRSLEAIAHLAHDPTRRAIDEVLGTTLNFPSLAAIRELVAREPGLTAKDIAPRKSQAQLSLEPAQDDLPLFTPLAKRKLRAAKPGSLL